MHGGGAVRNCACEQRERSCENGEALEHEQISWQDSLRSFLICVRLLVKQISNGSGANRGFRAAQVLGRIPRPSSTFRLLSAEATARAIRYSLWHNATAQFANHPHGRTQTRVTQRRPYRRHGSPRG